MTITVSLNSVGILKALDVVMTARGDALRRPATEPKLVSVSVGPSTAPNLSGRSFGQDRIVDLML